MVRVVRSKDALIFPKEKAMESPLLQWLFLTSNETPEMQARRKDTG